MTAVGHPRKWLPAAALGIPESYVGITHRAVHECQPADAQEVGIEGAVREGSPKPDQTEFIERLREPLARIPDLIARGEIRNAGALALAFRALQALGTIQGT